jgi:hypothetical protein
MRSLPDKGTYAQGRTGAFKEVEFKKRRLAWRRKGAKAQRRKVRWEKIRDKVNKMGER